MAHELDPLRLTAQNQIQAESDKYKFRAVGNQVFIRRRDETFHEFLVDHLLGILGKSWFEAEAAKPIQDRHVIVRWNGELRSLVRQAKEQGRTTDGQVFFTPTGSAQALLVLADDLYQLECKGRAPKKLIRRLRDRRAFQGARYELLAASIFARCGFELEFIEDKSKKTPEFEARHPTTSERVMVEAKSRHRAGVLHETLGDSDAIRVAATEAKRLFDDAIQQNPGSSPFIVFIDLNLPLTPDVPTNRKPWFSQITTLIDDWQKTEPTKTLVNTVVVTNFGWHYFRESPAAPREFVIVESATPRYPLTTQIRNLLHRAVGEYGFLPDQERHEKAVRARYPEFNQ